LRRRALVGLLLGLVAGCGGSSSGTLSSAAPSPRAAGCVSAPPVATAVSGTTDLTKKPQIEVSDGQPPCNLVVADLVEGTGPAAQQGQQLTMKYVGALYATGKQFDASWDRGQDFPFVLGAGNVIAGWDQGLVGMKVGGRRQLVIPPELGYGAQGQGEIPPGATLIFVVDLVKIG
jgi:peptidylprolyl isomerase